MIRQFKVALGARSEATRDSHGATPSKRGIPYPIRETKEIPVADLGTKAVEDPYAMFSVAVHAGVPTTALRETIYAYPTFQRGVEDALADLAA
jgi:hypothetical protein